MLAMTTRVKTMLCAFQQRESISVIAEMVTMEPTVNTRIFVSSQLHAKIMELVKIYLLTSTNANAKMGSLEVIAKPSTRVLIKSVTGSVSLLHVQTLSGNATVQLVTMETGASILIFASQLLAKTMAFAP